MIQVLTQSHVLLKNFIQKGSYKNIQVTSAIRVKFRN